MRVETTKATFQGQQGQPSDLDYPRYAKTRNRTQIMYDCRDGGRVFLLGVDTSYLLMLYLQVKVEEADKDTYRFQRLLRNLQFGKKSGRIV